MKISTSKSEVQCISKQPTKLTISIYQSELNQVEQFIYLGVIFADARYKLDVKERELLHVFSV